MPNDPNSAPRAMFERLRETLAIPDPDGEIEAMARAMWLWAHALNDPAPDAWNALEDYDRHYWRLLAKAAREGLAEHCRRQRH